MKLNQNNPGAWLGVGVIIAIVGSVTSAGAPDSGLGLTLIVVGGILAVVGLVLFVVQSINGSGK